MEYSKDVVNQRLKEERAMCFKVVRREWNNQCSSQGFDTCSEIMDEIRAIDRHRTWWLVQQPNGLFARYSGALDDFTHRDMPEAEAMRVCLLFGCETDDEAADRIRGAVENQQRWEDAIERTAEARR